MNEPQAMPHRDRSAAAPLPRRRRAFTLIELLTVMAIIGILAAILIPTVAGANNSAKKAKTKVMFAQWATAIEGFRQEYGYYPNFTLFPTGLIDSDTKSEQFIQTLTGRRLTGAPLETGDPGLVAGNTKRISFISFGQGDLTTANRVQDAWGNITLAVLMDKNQDGLIKIASDGDYTHANEPAVNGTKPIADNGIVRAGVVFYSPGSSATDIVKSWE